MKSNAIPIHPIRNEKDYDRAVARIGHLISAAPDTPEGDELNVLATLVDAYEAKHYLMDAPDPVVAIQFRMEQQGLTRKDLEPMIGSRARVSEVLNRKRSLTLEMVRRIVSGLGISADALIGSAKTTARNPAYPRSAHKTSPRLALATKRKATGAGRTRKAVVS